MVTTADARRLSIWAEREIGWVLENRWKQLARNTGGTAPDVDWVGVQREIEVGLQRRLRRELQVEPLIICLVQPAPAGTPAYKGRADAEPDSRPAPRGGRHGGRDGGSREGSSREPVIRNHAPAPQRVQPAGAAASTATAPAVVKTPTLAPVVEAAAAKREEPEMPANRVRRRRSTASN